MLSEEKREIAKAVESRQEKFWKVSDAIWTYAELGLEEYKSSKLLADTLETAGFRVERGVAGMPTAFVASWSRGTGKPVIGFLGEFDALPMLSQRGGPPRKTRLYPAGPGMDATIIPCVPCRPWQSPRSGRSWKRAV
jgi:aminobenzoyl-glutamate utilization protein B